MNVYTFVFVLASCGDVLGQNWMEFFSGSEEKNEVLPMERIFRGFRAEPHEFPWMAKVRVSFSGYKQKSPLVDINISRQYLKCLTNISLKYVHMAKARVSSQGHKQNTH